MSQEPSENESDAALLSPSRPSSANEEIQQSFLRTSESAIIAPRQSSSDSPEVMEGHRVASRVINIASIRTQTDWYWVEQRRHEESQPVQSEFEDFAPKPAEEFQTDLEGLVTDPDSENEETEMENMQENELYGIPGVGPPSLLAYKPESKQPPVVVVKVPKVTISKILWELFDRKLELVLCDYCQQPTKPFINQDQLENNPNLELLFCCDRAKEMREFLLDEERTLAAVEVSKKIDVGPHPPFMSKQEKRAAKERAEQRLREWELQRVQNSGNQNRFFSSGSQIKTISYRLSNEKWTIREEPQYHQMDINNPSDIFTLQRETHVQQMRKHVLMKLYPNGEPFLTIFPDGTGNVFYPSGGVAILISSVESGDFTYIVMEETDTKPNIQAIFTSRGQSTCYHPNGLICETGALRRRWSWLELEPRIQVPPFQPICLALNNRISLRIHTQDRIYLTFTSQKSRVRFNVGSKLKLTQPEGLALLGPDMMVQRNLQMKSLEIYYLLDRIQTHISYQHLPNPEKIKTQYSLVAQMERLGRQVDKGKSPKKTKIPMTSKEI